MSGGRFISDVDMGRCGCCNIGNFCTSVIFQPLIRPTGSRCWTASPISPFISDPILYSSSMFDSNVDKANIKYNFCNCQCTNYFKNLNVKLDNKNFIVDDFTYLARDFQNSDSGIRYSNCKDFCGIDIGNYAYIRNTGNLPVSNSYISLSGTTLVPYSYYSNLGYTSYNKSFGLAKRKFSKNSEKYLTATSDLCDDEIFFQTRSYRTKPPIGKKPCDSCLRVNGCIPFHPQIYVTYVSKQKIEALNPIKMDVKATGVVDEKICRAVVYPILYQVTSVPPDINHTLKTLSKVTISQKLENLNYTTIPIENPGTNSYPLRITSDSEMRYFFESVANYGVESTEFSLVPNITSGTIFDPGGCDPFASYSVSGIQTFPSGYINIPPPIVDDFNLSCRTYNKPFGNGDPVIECKSHVPKPARVLAYKAVSAAITLDSYTIANSGSSASCSDSGYYIDSSGNPQPYLPQSSRPPYCGSRFNDIPNYMHYLSSPPDLSTVHGVSFNNALTWIPFDLRGFRRGGQEYLNQSQDPNIVDQYLSYSGTGRVLNVENVDNCAYFEDSIEWEYSITVDLGYLFFSDSPRYGSCNPDDICQNCSTNMSTLPMKRGWVKDGAYWFIPWKYPTSPSCGRELIVSPDIGKAAAATATYKVKVTIS